MGNATTVSQDDTESLERTNLIVEPPRLGLQGSPSSSDFSTLRPLLHELSLPTDVHGTKQHPLPDLNWVDSTKLFKEMWSKDTYKEAPEAQLRLRHPCIFPAMRTIVIERLMDICQCLFLQRESFYLALDIFDRFMDAQCNVERDQIMLIGITCLLLACKMEEKRRMRLTDFLCLYGGVCSAATMIKTELTILKALDWRLSHHVTVNSWTTMYMQLRSSKFRPSFLEPKPFEYPAFSQTTFARAMHILDMCCLDIASRQFSSSVLAASAYYLMTERSGRHLRLITGYELVDIIKCVNWLEPFSTFISKHGIPNGTPTLKCTEDVNTMDLHRIQFHNVTMKMLDKVRALRKLQERDIDTAQLEEL